MDWKKLLLLLLGLVLLSGCALGGAEAVVEPVRLHGQLRVDENGCLVDQEGARFQLRGMSTHGLTWFAEYVNAGAFKTLADHGANAVRAAMYTDGPQGYVAQPQENLTLMLQAIENAKALGMYILVDWHILQDGDPNTHLAQAITFFDAIASRYPNDPAVIYELCNEPNGVDWQAITDYAYAVEAVIRQYSPQALLILGTPGYSYNLSDPISAPFPKDNVLHAFHYYAGQHLDYQWLETALDQGLPVIVSEWGVADEDALDEARKFLDYCNRKGVSWFGWSLSNKEEVFSALRSDCQKLSNWTWEDLTSVGQLFFEGLKG